MTRDELLNKPMVDVFGKGTTGFSDFSFYDFPLNNEEIDFLSLNQQEYVLSAEFYINVSTSELVHPKWWQIRTKAKISHMEHMEWVRKTMPICSSEYGLIQDNMQITLNGWMILKALGNVGTSNIRNIQIESLVTSETEHIKTEDK